MSSKTTTKCSKSHSPDTSMATRGYIPVQLTDLSIFDNAYAYMKERFDQEMKRIDQQMKKFSTDLMQYYGGGATVTANMVSPSSESTLNNWDSLTNSPLVQGEGPEKTLKLQFDVSQFDPEEITVKLVNDVLVIAAMHQEKTNGSTIYQEYNREYMLPPGTDPEMVVSSLSRDGVLTVQARLPRPTERNILIQRQISEENEDC